MKYLLCDLAVLTSFLLVARKLLCVGSSSLLAPECHPAHAYANQTFMSVEQQPQQQAVLEFVSDAARQDDHGVLEIRQVVNASSSSEDEREPPRASSLEPPSKEDSTFPLGSMVELYADSSHFSIPAIITGYNMEESSTNYNLKNAVTHARISRVAREFIHPYQVHEDGTKAACNVGALRKIYFATCQIVSHSITKSGFVSYEVSYLDENDEMSHPENLPFSRVQRDRRNNSLHNSTASVEHKTQQQATLKHANDKVTQDDHDVLNNKQMPASEFRQAVNASFSSEDKREPPSTFSLNPPSKEDSTFPLGSMVELYGDDSHFSIPAIITGYKIEESSVKYNLENAITNRISSVAREFIHPYQLYEDGMKAACNVGELRKIYFATCWIVSHSIAKSGFVSYQVSYLDEDEVSHPEYLSFSRVQRDRRKNSLSKIV
eukprot:CAMPEP_0172299216 /NCGR_PEP_ID=MMETSP1058-20130122/1571_1 /TAXON_ID=83371 /ORGANISM="Detonula confervacea, Strain CCMP 353" /LENGTH=433 /DNA_ID=CAMNT_0013008577 /DNA_START=82 /DNA_END=1383 /DNA_ORIENTATION=-